MEEQTADDRRQTDEWDGCDKLADLRCEWPHCSCIPMENCHAIERVDHPPAPPSKGDSDEPDYTIQDFKDEVRLYLEEWQEGVREFDELVNADYIEPEQQSIMRYFQLQRYDHITKQAFLNGAAAFAAFACKRAHIEPITDND